jgi:hypothetical protein
MIDELEIESWSLDIVMANLLLPKLLYFKNWADRYGCPSDLKYDEWEEILDEIIWAFTYISQEYPSVANDLIKEVDIVPDKKNEDSFLTSSTIVITYIQGKSEKDYGEGLKRDRRNIDRCQQGLNLFAKYYMSIWN